MTQPNVSGFAFRRNMDQVVMLSGVIPSNISESSQELLSASHDLARLEEYDAEEERTILSLTARVIR
jgi:hypothetical protein